ncbi:lamin tail domain-containing protein [Streptomyces sp. NPDC003038]|uniref:lamin tail domain-containing protein n=1 Tax=unclassified Streptomyces TaxID=2593676 RepID=UPI0033AC1D89
MNTIVTSGFFPSATLDASQLSGTGTDHIRWGTSGAQSGYMFRGSAADVQLDGSEFVIGTFVHRNFPINVTSRFDVDLKVNVLFEDGSTSDFTFTFNHNETPNNTANPEDLVDLPTFVSPKVVTVDGKEYKAVLSGFKLDGQIVRRFVSPESGVNHAEIVCLFAPQPGAPDVIICDLRHQGTAAGQGDEYVELLNKGSEPDDLSGWVLECKSTGRSFTFPAGTTIQPGQRIRVYTNESHPDFGGHSFGSAQEIWKDKGDIARLRKDNFVVDQYGYGDKAQNRVPAP